MDVKLPVEIVKTIKDIGECCVKTGRKNCQLEIAMDDYTLIANIEFQARHN